MKIGIIGGGITGLVVGYQLGEKGNRVFVFEKDDSLGGLAKTFKKEKWQSPLEIFFHHFFTSDDQVQKLVRDLDLEKELVYRKVKTSIYTKGEIYPLDSPLNVLKLPNLNWKDKLRMGGVVFLLRQLPFLAFGEKKTAFDLFPRLIGFPGWELIWKNLLEGKFGYLASQIPFSWLWARLKARSQKLGYLQGSTEKILIRLKEEIEKKGEIFLKTPVSEIENYNSKWKIKAKGKEIIVDKIILALPFPQALKLTEKFIDKRNLENWRGLKTIGALNLVLRMRSKFLPGETYWLNILEKDFPFIAIVEQTNFIEPSFYGGEHLVYIGGYYDPASPIFEASKEKVLRKFAPYLRRLNPSFEKFLIDFDLFSSLSAQPVIPLNYSQIKPPLEIVPKNIFWATANHIYPWDRGLNFSIRLARKVSRLA